MEKYIDPGLDRNYPLDPGAKPQDLLDTEKPGEDRGVILKNLRGRI